MSTLTEKQRRFVEAYMGVARGNATEAARLAGYSGGDNALGVRGSELLRNSKVMRAIAERTKSDPLVLGREELQQFWSRVLTAKELDAGDEPAMKERLRASELLARSQGVFVDRVEVEDGPERTARLKEERAARIKELEAVLGK